MGGLLMASDDGELRRVLITKGAFELVAGSLRVAWGAQDAEGFYTPALFDDADTRALHLQKVGANAVYEALVMLSYFVAKSPSPERLPYNEEQIEQLQLRLLTAWPELRALYAPEPNRAERRAR